MVYTAAQQAPATKQAPAAKPAMDAANSAEAQQLLARLREMGIALPGTLNPPSSSTGAGNATTAQVTALPSEDGAMSFACGACSEYNVVNVARETFYVVTAGTSVGVFRDASLADSFVVGVKCSGRKKYSTLEAALGAFQAALALDTVKLLSKD